MTIYFRKGKIQSRPCALQIGHGENLDDFEGDIDDVSYSVVCMFVCISTYKHALSACSVRTFHVNLIEI